MTFWNKTDKEKQLHDRELEIYKRERVFDLDKELFKSSSEVEIIKRDNKEIISEDKHATDIQILKSTQDISVAKVKAEANEEVIELAFQVKKLEAEAELEGSLSEIKTDIEVAKANKNAINNFIDERKLSLTYIQKNIDSLLDAKDGIIEGQRIVIEAFKEQLNSANDMLRVLVAKLPNVDLNKFSINVEMPATTPAKGNNNPGGGKPDLK